MTPDAHTLQEHFLDVGNGHQLYVHDWGNADAADPILYLHGGPGGGCNDGNKLRFDPEQHRVIFFDQRGSGRSLPYGTTEHNTTDDLVADIEKIAAFLKLSSFVITGGSWGSTLALAYAIKHPKRVEALVLQGIFTGSQAEIDWIDKGLFQTFYPEAWQAFLDRTPKSHHKDPAAYHTKRAMTGNDDEIRESAFAYSCLEGGVLRLDDRFTPGDPLDFDPASTRLEMYYLANGCFMPDRYILNNAHKITAPVWLVQGRYDMVCPPVAAHELHSVLPNSKLIYTTAGHASSDRANQDVLKTILLQFA